MTSLLPSSLTSRRSESEVGEDLATRRPLALVATLGGVAAAGATLVLCLAVGVVGWFLTDGGSHGAPRDGLRTGALGWLLGHGSGVLVEGVPVTAVPLAVTALCLWTQWRVGSRVGASVSGHGPDASGIIDGERDWTVPIASALFAVGYVVTAVVTLSLAATESTQPDVSRVVLWSVVMCLVAGGGAIAVGSGRAAIWAARVPETVRAVAHTARRTLVLWLVVCLSIFVVALVADFSTAANVMAQLHADTGDVVLFVLLSLLVLPNAVACAGAYLLGPGFSVGAGTLVTPSAVVLGPLPTFPMLAALPDDGAVAGWTPWLVVLPPVVAFLAVARAQMFLPTVRYDEGALRGCAGGVVAGVGFAILAGVAGGAVGPGRMSDVGPLTFDVLLHAVTSFGIGGLVGGLVMTWWQRRGSALTEQRLS